MHIAVDAHNLLSDRRGIGVYLRSVLSCILQADVMVTLLVRDLWPRRLQRALARELGSNGFSISRRVPSGADVVWHPWNGTFFDAGSLPSVATIHDVTPFAFPAADATLRRSQQEPFLRSARATSIITDSEFSRTEIERYLGVELSRITVVPLAASNALRSTREDAPRDTSVYRSCSAVFSQRLKENAFQAFAKKSEASRVERRAFEATVLQKPYILTVGANDMRKNIATLAQAHRHAFPNGEVALVCVGRGAPEGTIGLTDVSFEELRSLYHGAVAFAMPSIYEGFGIPPLEAMLCETPVVVSRAASLPEVCGDAALYVESPMEVEAWVTALQRIVRDEALRTQLRERGRLQAQKFSWDRTAEQTLAVLHEVASGSEPGVALESQP